MERNRDWPPRQVLFAHYSRTRAARSRKGKLDPALHRNQPRCRWRVTWRRKCDSRTFPYVSLVALPSPRRNGAARRRTAVPSRPAGCRKYCARPHPRQGTNRSHAFLRQPIAYPRPGTLHMELELARNVSARHTIWRAHPHPLSRFHFDLHPGHGARHRRDHFALHDCACCSAQAIALRRLRQTRRRL